MSQRMAGRVAIVTGAGSEGIGRAVCHRFAEEGAVVAAFDLNGEQADETASQIRTTGGKAMGLRVDVRDGQAIARGVADVVAAFGGVDTLVSCAGVMHNASVEDETEAGWSRILDVNL